MKRSGTLESDQFLTQQVETGIVRYTVVVSAAACHEEVQSDQFLTQQVETGGRFTRSYDRTSMAISSWRAGPEH